MSFAMYEIGLDMTEELSSCTEPGWKPHVCLSDGDAAMEAKWMSGAGIGRIKSIPKSIKKGVRRHQTS